MYACAHNKYIKLHYLFKGCLIFKTIDTLNGFVVLEDFGIKSLRSTENNSLFFFIYAIYLTEITKDSGE